MNQAHEKIQNLKHAIGLIQAGSTVKIGAKEITLTKEQAEWFQLGMITAIAEINELTTADHVPTEAEILLQTAH